MPLTNDRWNYVYLQYIVKKHWYTRGSEWIGLEAEKRRKAPDGVVRSWIAQTEAETYNVILHCVMTKFKGARDIKKIIALLSYITEQVRSYSIINNTVLLLDCLEMKRHKA